MLIEKVRKAPKARSGKEQKKGRIFLPKEFIGKWVRILPIRKRHINYKTAFIKFKIYAIILSANE